MNGYTEMEIVVKHSVGTLVGLKRAFGRLAFAFSAFGGENSRILLEIS